MILVTGAAGLIGSSLVKELNARGRNDIIGVDNLKDGKKIFNLNDLYLTDYFEKESFLNKIQTGSIQDYTFEAIFHLGACSNTTEWNGSYLIENNFEYSKALYTFSRKNDIPFIYASSAAVYGLGENGFEEVLENENPINAYAYSKYQFDNYIRSREINGSQVVGLRYFNVYGPRESHKGGMASVLWHFSKQIKKNKKVQLFRGINGIEDGEQKRDFVYIDDCIKANLWAAFQNKNSGIFNLGTGQSRSFNELAEIILGQFGLTRKNIEYIDFPKKLVGSYQNYTRADLQNLRKAGFQCKFKSLEKGIPLYLERLKNFD